MSVEFVQRRGRRQRDVQEDGASVESPRSASPPEEEEDAVIIKRPTAAMSKGKSLKDRSKIPPSFAVTFGTILGLQCFSGMWQLSTLESWISSLQYSFIELATLTMNAIQVVFGQAPAGSLFQYAQTIILTTFCGFLAYVFFVAPALAGLWTGRKARRAVFHRYMGLSYLIHYMLACVELLTNYTAAKNSYLGHIVAVTVLPELHDPGYYSDKAVLSRNFVHENIFFTVMSVFGSVYYNETARANLRTNIPGRIIEAIYVFWPYIAIRPWYPITRFSNAGQTYKGRSEKNQGFYKLATSMVKFFYLWAKYFLCFFMNFMIYLDLIEDKHWHFMHAMLLLNTGTVSLSIFLHTLRFKKVLPAKFTMSLYLGQIYLTFTAIPIALEMFLAHPKLCGLCLAGLVANMTRSRSLHGVWCACAMGLLTLTDISW